MKFFKPFVFTIMAAAAALAQAQDAASCDGGLAIPAFNFQQEAVELDKAAFAIGARWTQDQEWLKLPFADRLKKRDAAIEDVYAKMRERRKAVYSAATCKVVSTKKCASTPGRKKLCPMSVDAPAGTHYVADTLKAIDNDFHTDQHPQLGNEGKTVTYTVKKTGSGSNTAGFSAMARFIPGVVDNWVAKDVARAQDYLTPLLRAQNLNVSGSVSVNPQPATSTCLDDLKLLVKMKTDGMLTETEFQAAKAKLTHCFNS